MNFTVESGVARVSNRKGRKGTAFPLADMAVGDSFLIEFDGTGDEGKKLLESWRRKVLGAKKKFQKEFEGEFSTAVVSGGLRVWRTE